MNKQIHLIRKEMSLSQTMLQSNPLHIVHVPKNNQKLIQMLQLIPRISTYSKRSHNESNQTVISTILIQTMTVHKTSVDSQFVSHRSTASWILKQQ